jgi:Cu-Zn family superoxide dismutase
MKSRIFLAGLSALAMAAATLSAQVPAQTQTQTQMAGHTMNHSADHAAAQVAPAGAQIAARAKAEIKGTGINGTAEFVEYRVADDDKLNPAGWKFGEIEVTVKVTGLKPGLHGMHLHAIGTCSPDFAAAGGHFDPGPAGNVDVDMNHPFHMGDLPNVTVDANGVGTAKARTTRVSLTAGPLSVFDADGTAIIIHAEQDKGITGEAKTGVGGGARIACGVLVKQ